jgi:hypothetical protein
MRQTSSPPSPVTLSKNKRQKRLGGGAAAVEAPERAPTPQQRLTSRGRNVKLPSKYK